MRGRLSTLAACLLLVACGSGHPLGIDDETWAAMTTEQRLDAYTEAEKRRVERAAAAAREAKARQKAEAARARAAEARRPDWWDAVSGPPGVGSGMAIRLEMIPPRSRTAGRVTLRGGLVNVPTGPALSFSDGWRAHGRTRFVVLEGEARAVDLCRKSDSDSCVTVHAARYRGQTCFARRAFKPGRDPAGRSGAVCVGPDADGRLNLSDTVKNVRLRVRSYRP